jgi:hypothetical protein
MLARAKTKNISASTRRFCAAKRHILIKCSMADLRKQARNSASLPEDNPESFDILQRWVYTGQLRPLKYVDFRGCTFRYWSVVDMYHLSDKLCLFPLRDRVTEQYLDNSQQINNLPNLDTMRIYWTTAAPGSALRKLVLHIICYLLHGHSRTEAHLSTWSTTEIHKLLTDNSEMLLEYLDLTRNPPVDKPAPDPREMPRCTFHYHGEDEPCPRKPKSC